MSVSKRKWTTEKGEEREAWVVRYADANGDRHIATFKRKKEAEEYHDTVRVDVRTGTHVAPSKSVTVAQAGKAWIRACEAAALERTTVDAYQQHLTYHILPYLGTMRLSSITVATVRDWQDRLRLGTPPAGATEGAPRSADMVRRVTRSLGTLLADAQEVGAVGQNVVRTMSSRRKKAKGKGERRANRKLRVGVDIPAPVEIRGILAKAEGRWRPLLLVAVFCGLRASELRGLRWEDVDLKTGDLHVRQRADRYNAIGAPKSEAGERTVPIPPSVLQALREWKLICPRRRASDPDTPAELHFVFPNGRGMVETHANIAQRGLAPAQIAAGVTVPVKDEEGRPVRDDDGKPMVTAKYPGLHALRHFYASWCINRVADGGLELPLKVVQTRLGHSSITMTADTYGHLFARADDSAELAAGERLLLG